MLARVIGASLVAGAPALKDPPAGQGIAGTWDLVAVVQGGKEMPADGRRDEFAADGRWLVRGVLPDELAFTYAIDPKADPSVLRWRSGTDAKRGLCRVAGDTLTMAYFPLEDDLPRTFDSPNGSLLVVFTLKHAKARD
jgi:uncharacterized protein (TIGR03067 family)